MAESQTHVIDKYSILRTPTTGFFLSEKVAISIYLF